MGHGAWGIGGIGKILPSHQSPVTSRQGSIPFWQIARHTLDTSRHQVSIKCLECVSLTGYAIKVIEVGDLFHYGLIKDDSDWRYLAINLRRFRGE
jgi:hypothetical protein